VHISLNMLFLYYHTTTTENYPLSLHDALPICDKARDEMRGESARAYLEHATLLEHIEVPVFISTGWQLLIRHKALTKLPYDITRSEEHTSELQSRFDIVCRLLLEKKKKYYVIT